MHLDDHGRNNNSGSVRFCQSMRLGLNIMKATYFLIFAMVAMSFGASAFELSTRDAYASSCVYTMSCR